MKLFRSLFSAPGCDSSTPQASTPEGSVHQAPPGVCVGESSALPEGGRLHARLEGRYVTVLRLDGKLSCIDSVCFHAGGPLGIGDIEDVNGHKCLVCPWHFYKIDVDTGDKYYQGVEFQNGKMVPGEWKSNGVRQRVHPVAEADGKIYVDAVKGGGGVAKVDSDNYACDASCGERVLHAPPAKAGKNRLHSVGGDGRAVTC
ncbi:Rieske domain-containing protein [Tetrabaena socialis]|uniref:Rieske domain-containing protein n=1 Tax=Tetrabaena socialis TaxID=47790 RepID=A0A2J8A9C9_9CHLO|nr:Rieske domain-containing protein [Tetrabaena socialis]|eukprot:PNH09110.1 Rieske domain-containing protein [Tetrabaena socialis]